MSDRRDRVRRAYNLHLVDGFTEREGGMPTLDAVEALSERLRAFTSCARCSDPKAGVHFFLDDYRFEAVWGDPLRYAPMLSRFACALTPDFSCYLDMPEPMQRWNVYRGRAVGRVWQDAGLRVVPTLTWGEPDTYAFCFEGLPRGSAVALSTVGLMDCRGRGSARTAREPSAAGSPSRAERTAMPRAASAGERTPQTASMEAGSAPEFEGALSGRRHECR